MHNKIDGSLAVFCAVFLSIPFFFATQQAFAEPVISEILTTPERIKALQKGEHIIYFRHGATDSTQRDSNRENFEDCTTQRNLSAQGREQVKQIGLAIRALKIPIEEVASSPYCRCKDTAKLAFGEFRIEPDLQFSISKDEKESKQLGEHLRNMMLNVKTGSSNTVFVGHTSNLRDGLGVWPKPEGVIAVFQKREGKLVYKGMIKPDEWPKP